MADIESSFSRISFEIFLWGKVRCENKANKFPLRFKGFYKFIGNNFERFRNFVLTNNCHSE